MTTICLFFEIFIIVLPGVVTSSSIAVVERIHLKLIFVYEIIWMALHSIKLNMKLWLLYNKGVHCQRFEIRWSELWLRHEFDDNILESLWRLYKVSSFSFAIIHWSWNFELLLNLHISWAAFLHLQFFRSSEESIRVSWICSKFKWNAFRIELFLVHAEAPWINFQSFKCNKLFSCLIFFSFGERDGYSIESYFHLITCMLAN